MEIGQVVGGDYSNIIIRQKQGFDFEIGDLVVSISKGKELLLQVTDLFLSSQISDLNIERLSGSYLQGEKVDIYEKESRLYKMAKSKASKKSILSRKRYLRHHGKINEKN